MHKKGMCLFWMISLLWVNAACGFAEAAGSSEPVQQDATPAMAAPFREVLYENEPFYHVQSGQYLSLQEIGRLFDGAEVTFPRYTLADVDQDGNEELVLVQSVNDDPYYGYLVLDSADGNVYGYEFVYRALLDLKADGTFSFSSGAADSGFGYARLDGSLSLIPLAQSRSVGTTVRYMQGMKPVSAQTFARLAAEQSAKPDAVWFALDEGVA